MFNPFGWLRQAAKNAVLHGIADACEVIEQASDPDPMQRLAVGYQRVSTQAQAVAELPAPSTNGVLRPEPGQHPDAAPEQPGPTHDELRAQQVASLLAEGKSVAEVATALGVSESTVRRVKKQAQEQAA